MTYDDAKAAFLDERRRHVSNSATLTVAQLLRAQCKNACDFITDRVDGLHQQMGFIGSAERPLATEHWWLIDAAGTILDPTREQFGERELVYTNFDPDHHSIVRGKCPNCGMTLYGRINDPKPDFCDQDCAEEYEAYMAREMQSGPLLPAIALP